MKYEYCEVLEWLKVHKAIKKNYNNKKENECCSETYVLINGLRIIFRFSLG